MEAQIPNIQLPNDFKLVLTGKGRVAGGAIEVLDKIGLKNVSPEDFLEKSFNEPNIYSARSRILQQKQGRKTIQ